MSNLETGTRKRANDPLGWQLNRDGKGIVLAPTLSPFPLRWVPGSCGSGFGFGCVHDKGSKRLAT